MSTKPKRIKSAAAVYVPQSKEDVTCDIRKIGDLQRELARVETAMNDEIGEITDRYAPQMDVLKKTWKCCKKAFRAGVRPTAMN